MHALIEEASGFDSIGPYRLEARDLIAACFIISFKTGSAAMRVRSFLLVFVSTAFIPIGYYLDNYLISVAGVAILLISFFINPFFQARKNRQHIYLSYDQDGIVVETDEVRSLYKWATIRTFCKFRSLLLIQITDAHALVIADRFTTSGNMDRICSVLDRNC